MSLAGEQDEAAVRETNTHEAHCCGARNDSWLMFVCIIDVHLCHEGQYGLMILKMALRIHKSSVKTSSINLSNTCHVWT